MTKRVRHDSFIALLDTCRDLGQINLVGIVAVKVLDIAPFCTEKSAQTIGDLINKIHDCALWVNQEKFWLLGKLLHLLYTWKILEIST
jgi:hypothetical protein